jgi:hypothetical protein
MMEIPLDAIVTLILFQVVYTPLAAPREVKLIVSKRPSWLFVAIGFPLLLSLLISCGSFVFSLYNSTSAKFLWPSLILVLLVIDLALVFISNQFTTFDGIIKLLEREAVNRWRKTGRLSGDAINDLIELGKKVDAYQTKEAILNSLYDLSRKACNNQSYNGDSLEGLMIRLVDVLVSNSSGNPETYIKPVQILQDMVKISRDRNSLNTIDLEHTLRAAGLLSIVILQKSELKLYTEDLLVKYCTSLEYVADICPDLTAKVGETLYEIGIQSAKRDVYVPARHAISKLIILYSRNQDLKLAANVLGLFAFLWCAGDSVRRSVTFEFEYFAKNYRRSLPQAFDSAIEYFTMNMQFETTNKLIEMAAEVKRKK